MSQVEQEAVGAEPLLARRGLEVAGWQGVALCVLLAVAQVALAGYEMGVGNQGIQVAFLKRWADPTLFARDEMVRQTMPWYPSLFFRMLAPLSRLVAVEQLYLGLQLVTAFGTLAAVYGLSRSIFRSHAAALAAVGVLVAGHLQGLGGDALYSQGFTHTFAALPLGVLALLLAFEGKWVWAWVVAGLLFNVHALTAAYTMLMLGAGQAGELGGVRSVWRMATAAVGPVVAAMLAVPTAAQMIAQRQAFDGTWMNLMRVRSAEHSFPSAWWTAGDPDVPRFALLAGLFALSLSFGPVRNGERQMRARRMTLWMAGAVAALFAAGYLFTEVWPWAPMVRLQPFRASRLLLVLMVVHIAHGAVAAMRAGWKGRPEGAAFELPWVARVGEVAVGVLLLVTLGVPAAVGLLPLMVVLALAVAVTAGRVSWRQAVVVVGSVLVAVLAWRQIGFVLPLVSRNFTLSAGAGMGGMTLLGLLCAGGAAALAAGLAAAPRGRVRNGVGVMAVALGVWGGQALWEREQGELGRPEWAGVAAWARDRTPKDAVILTPTGMGNFRTAAERAIVGDWRDGTQLYFCAAFGPTWLERVMAIEPGLMLSEDGRRLLSRGEPLETLPDGALLAAAERFHAEYVLLRTPAEGERRRLVPAHAEGGYTLYEARAEAAATGPAPAAPPTPPPAGVTEATAWDSLQGFMRETVLPNIEKHRKADLTLTVLGADGRPLQDMPVMLEQTGSPFTFGCSLGFFEKPPALSGDGDQPGVMVRPTELEKMPEVFNGSMIPFSGKWAYIEPEKGVYRWSDLDKYVEYGEKHGLTLEFHHLTGIRPGWVARMGGPGGMQGLSFPPVNAEMQKEFLRHCEAVVERYQGRIRYFQVSNEKFMMQYVPAAFRMLQAKYPGTEFGLSDCVNFWNVEGRRYGTASGQYKGLDAVKWLTDQGIKPAFFSMHGHHPRNLWPDAREMYKVFDTIAATGVRVHVTEEYTQLAAPFMGSVVNDAKVTMTPERQADLLEYYLTVCFSHPAVDLVNLWGGMSNDGFGTAGSGLLDRNVKLQPGFERLKKLIRETWRTKVELELPLEGRVKARVFHGTYEATVKAGEGKVLKGTFTVPERAAAAVTLRLRDGKLAAD